MIVWDLVYSLSVLDFRISFYKSYHDSLKFSECRYFTKWPYFGTEWRYSQMVGHSGSTTGIVHADMALTRSKVKVEVTGLLNLRKLAKPCMLAAMTAAPLWGFLVMCSSYCPCGLWDIMRHWLICWLFACLPGFPHLLLFFFTYFPYLFTSLLIFSCENRPASFSGHRS